jgi:hypothetical protein
LLTKIIVVLTVLSIAGCTADVNEDIPGTVAAAFTATAEAEPVTPDPYLPTLSEYLETLGEKYSSVREKQRQVDNFDAVVAIYIIESDLGEKQPTRDDFESVVRFVYNRSAGFYNSSLSTPIQVLFGKWLRIAADNKVGGSVGGFLLEPSRDQAMILCLVADAGSRALSRHEEWRRPPEPACETAFAEYNAFDLGEELGYLGYLKTRFSVRDPY